MPESHQRLWGGRFAEAPDEDTLRFMAGRDVAPSPPADAHLIADDLWSTAAHVTMLARQGIIPPADAARLLDGLDELERRHAQGQFALDPAREDVHTNIEMALAELCGPEVGGRVHTGRSRNDQVATALRLYLRGRALEFAAAAVELAGTLLDVAAEHLETLMPGFTHHQPATPTTLGHVLTAYAEAVERDATRLLLWLDLHNRSPLGSAAGYGTTVPLDRDLTAALLAFDGPHLTSLDPLTTRGEPETDLALALATLLKHLASLAQTVILLGAPGYGLLRLSPAYCSGSSIMPQKGNPDTMEAIKAKAAVAGGLVAGLLGVGAAAFVGYNRDTQWSKYLIVDLVAEARDATTVMAGAWRSMDVDREQAAALAGGYFVGSTALMEWLVTAHGLPLRSAKHVIETAVRLSEEGSATAVTASALRAALREHAVELELDDAQVESVQQPASIVHAASAIGGPAPAAVQSAIAALRARLDADSAKIDAVHRRIREARARLKAMYNELTFAPYLVRSSASLVEAWSTQSMKYQPKGWLKNLRDDVQTAAKKLQGNDDAVLHAVYTSPSTAFCDAENILFYNVGTGYFASAAKRGVRFERSFAQPEPPPSAPHLYRHYHRYALARSNEAFTYWMPGQVWARWENVEMPTLNAFTKASTIWYQMKASSIEILQRPANTPEHFGLSITVQMPAGTKARVVDLLKPLLDGLICAFHVHNGDKLQEVSQRLGAMLNEPVESIAHYLCQHDNAILGQRCLLFPFSKVSVILNPADDRCLAAEVLLVPYDGQHWLLSGEMYEVESRGNGYE